MEIIVEKTFDNNKVVFVLFLPFNKDDKEVSVFQYSDFYSINRKFLNKWEFKNIESAYTFFEKTYKINKTEWLPPKIFILNKKIEYHITSSGTPQPFALNFNGTDLEVSINKSNDIDCTDVVLTLTKENMLKLGEQLLLFEVSDLFDDDCHIHLSPSDNITITFQLKKE